MAKQQKRGSLDSSSEVKFRPTSPQKCEPQSTTSLPTQTSYVSNLFLFMEHVARKILFVDINLLILLYLGFILVLSCLVDIFPPKYILNLRFSKKNCFLNIYFVKLGWGWTMVLAVPFNVLTSYVYCCGRRRNILLNLSRLVVATFFWLFWTSMYNYLGGLGKCASGDVNLQTNQSCSGSSFAWHSIDISGHCFILLYSTFVLIEECRVINSWEGICDFIREEEHNRSCEHPSCAPLRSLSDESFKKLKEDYPTVTPLIRALFSLIICLLIIWNYMLFNTVIFFHTLLEKFLGALTAVLTYYGTYQLWFSSPSLLPHFPGQGSLLEYVKQRRCSKKSKPNSSGTQHRVRSEGSDSDQHTLCDYGAY